MCLPSWTGLTRSGTIGCEEEVLGRKKLPIMSSTVQLDAIDRAILQTLQQEGRIAAYVALLNPRAVGRPGTSFTIINLESTQPAVRQAFEQAVQDTPEILDCHYVAGANDYLVRFTYRDAEDLERFHAEVLARLPGVVRSNSMLVLRTVKRTTALPLPD
jgi:Lrp/AsnC family transcriptional regulator, leucine-responsive regulatory protein